MDGNAQISDVEFDRGKKISIRFVLSFLSPQYFVAPAMLDIELNDNGQNNAGIANYSCGTLNQDTEFCTASSRNCIFPSSESNWAVSCSCRFGDTGLHNWVNQNDNRR